MRKKLLLFILPLFLMTGCSNFTTVSGDTDLNPKKLHINFNAFAKTNLDEINTLSIDNIDLTGFKNEDITNLKQMISNIYDTLGDYNYLLNEIGDTKDYYAPVKDYFTDNFYQTLINSDNAYIQKSITSIYQFENCDYYKTNVIEIKKNKDKNFQVRIQILAIQNTDTLYGQFQTLTFTSDYKISNIKIENEFERIENSTTPINETNITDTNKMFKNRLSTFLTSISNKYIYENYHSLENGTIEYKNKEEKEEKEKEINLQIKTFLTKEGLDTEVLKKLFLIGEGTFEDYGIVSYSLKNEGNTEESVYKVGFIHDKTIEYFTFTYSRLLDQITKVEVIEN